MDLQQLRYVTEVEKNGSITRAAKNLYMGQPNLSRAIKELEKEVGVTIFKRTAQGVEPTPMGAQFLGYAKTILSQVDELESLYKKEESQVFEFHISVPRATYISVAFTDFLSRVPPDAPLSVRFKETSSMGAATDVVNGESQLAIIRFQNIYEEYFTNFLDNLHLNSELLWEYNMVLLMSEDHPLAGEAEIPYHLLDGYTEIVHGDFQVPSLTFAQINRDAKMKGSQRRIYIYERGSQYNLLQRVTGTYMWVSPLPEEILLENRLVQIPCPSATANKDLLVFKDDHTLNRIEKGFIETVKNEIRTLKGE
jgi:DNA-binding transcriptional LysR family regulator